MTIRATVRQGSLSPLKDAGDEQRRAAVEHVGSDV